MITAVPGPTAVTYPELVTVATAGLELDQLMLSLVAFEGDTVADRLAPPPTSSTMLPLEMLTPVTDTVLDVGFGVGAGVGLGVGFGVCFGLGVACGVAFADACGVDCAAVGVGVGAVDSAGTPLTVATWETTVQSSTGLPLASRLDSCVN